MSNSAGRTNAVLKASGSCSAGGLRSMTCTLRRLPEFFFFRADKAPLCSGQAVGLPIPTKEDGPENQSFP
jgi:hypothetical protein